VAIKYAVEHYRRNMRRCMGSLYWQINDCWPVASWASIDSLGNWKALHYMAKRFFAPVVLSILEDANKNTVEMHVSSDLRHAFEGAVRWSVTDTAGAILHSGEMKAAVAAGADTLIGTVNLSECVAAHGKYSCLVWAELVDTAGAVVSENFATFVRPKHIELQDPGLSWEVVGKEGAWTVTVRSERPALWTWIEVDRPNVRCSDNFFHLRGTREITLSGRSIGKLSEAGLRRCIRVGSLYQTYSEKPAIRSRKRAVAPDAVNR